jgi:hypothetical protein
MLCVVTAVWVLTFALSRAHMMFQAYSDFTEAREDESWLLGQCRESVFYSRMKQHSSLCDEVAHKARDVLFLQAVRHVIDHSYLCGYDPCSELLDRLVAWALGRGLVLTTMLCLMLLLGPICLMPAYRRHMNMLADERVKTLYYTPYDRDQFLAHEALCGRARRLT